jgi:hypothetical protein
VVRVTGRSGRSGRPKLTAEQKMRRTLARLEAGGSWLASARRSLDWSQRRVQAELLAAGLRYSVAAISAWEVGRAPLPPEVRAAIERMLAESKAIPKIDRG